MKRNRRQQAGFSLVEVLLAGSVFALILVAFGGSYLFGEEASALSGQRSRAVSFAHEGTEAVRSIRDNAWNRLAEFTQTGLGTSNMTWVFDGEGTEDVFDGELFRTISISEVCRNGSDAIAVCPASYTDIHTRLISSSVSWKWGNRSTSTITQQEYLTNWDSEEWTQTDWSGGAGQTIWLNNDEYDTDNSNITISTAGQVTLPYGGLNDSEFNQASGSPPNDWPFTTSSNYTFNASDIEVTGGMGQLLGSSGNIDNIADTVVDTFEFNTTRTTDPRVVNVSGTIYAIIYEGAGADGFLTTVDISATGDIGSSVIETWEYGTSDGEEPDIIHVTGDIYALVYEGAGNDGFVSTVDIDTDGNINTTLIDTLEFNTGDADQPDIIQIDTNTYAVAYNGPGGDGWLTTFDIDSSGNISSVTDSLEFDTVDADDPKIIGISGDIYAIVYNGSGNDGWIVTVDIDSSGTIANSLVDSFEYQTTNGRNPSVLHRSGDVFIIGYRGNGADGFVSTIDIDTDGTINPLIDTLEFDTVDARNPEITHIADDTYAVAYEDNASADGFVAIFEIQTNGTIGTVIDELEYDTGRGHDPVIFSVGGDYAAIAYSGPGTDGWLTTIQMTRTTTYPSTVPDIYPTTSFSVTGPGTWTSFIETAAKNGGEIYYQLSDDDGSTWQYWNGSSWVTAGASNYNTATVVNTNIGSFDTSAEQILFRAFLESDGSQFVQLDNVNVVFSVSGASWNFDTWDVDGGEETPTGSHQTSGGNPGGYNNVTILAGESDEVGGFWEQSFTSYSASPSPVTFDYDYIVSTYTGTPDVSEIRIYVDTTSGTPSNQVGTISLSGTTGWTSATQIDLSSTVTAVTTYYLKLALWAETGESGGSGPFTVGFDNADLNLGTGGYPSSGSATSSAFDMGDTSPVQAIEWDEIVPSSFEDVTFELSTAPDSGGSPGTWTNWYGAHGAGTTFGTSTGSLVPTALNGNQWVRYRTTLFGSGSSTPTLQEVRINYK